MDWLEQRSASMCSGVLYAENSKDDMVESAFRFAHDVSSPLTALTLALESFDDLGESSQEVAQLALKQIQDLAGSFLDFGRSLSNEKPLKVSGERENGTCLGMVINAAMEQNRLLWHRKNINFETNVANLDALKVLVPKHTLCSTLNNVISNAAEAIKETGTISLIAKDLGSRIRLIVSDNGPGMNRNTLRKLGKAPVKSEKPAGNGLGIYLAQIELRRYGGEIGFESKLGLGTRVVIELPVMQGDHR